MGTVQASGRELLLFSQVGFFDRADFCLPIAALMVVVSLGIWAIWRWRTGFAKEQPLPTEREIEQYETMVKQGQLDPEEFAKIKAQLENPAAEGGQPDDDFDPPKDNQPPDTSIREM